MRVDALLIESAVEQASASLSASRFPFSARPALCATLSARLGLACADRSINAGVSSPKRTEMYFANPEISLIKF
jgi:hypothetical protein